MASAYSRIIIVIQSQENKLMTGKPAARIGDKVAYGVIVTGSPTVHIGT